MIQTVFADPSLLNRNRNRISGEKATYFQVIIEKDEILRERDMELKQNQAALILEADDKNEITVHVSSPDPEGLTGAICHAIAVKLMEDQNFQNELMDMMEEGPEGHEGH